MIRERTRIWYDLTMSLTYPSVLGAIIYFFFDASIQVTILPLLDRITVLFDPITTITQPQFYFFEAFGLTTGLGFLVFIVITFLVSIHHSVDYLYSKYSEAQYKFRYFVWDTVISLLLAIAYIILSKGASRSIHSIKLAFVVFWISFAFTYLVFIWWDINSYFELRNTDKNYAKFYLGMVRWFEISGIISFITLAFLSFLITSVNWFSYFYLILSIMVLGIFSLWFCCKVRTLEALSRKGDRSLVVTNKFGNVNSTSEMIAVRNMEISDITNCGKIFVDSYQEVYSEPWTMETGRARLLELYKGAPNYCFTLRMKQMIIGFILARPFSWHDGTRVWIEEIVVEKQHRGKGFGRLLLQTLITKCRQERAAGISLLSRKDSLAFKIYKKMGLCSSDWIHLEADLEDVWKVDRDGLEV